MVVAERESGTGICLFKSSSHSNPAGHSAERELELTRACSNGDFDRFIVLCNEEWDAFGDVKYRVDLLVPPDQVTTVHLADGADKACTDRLFLHHACIGGCVDIVKHLLELHREQNIPADQADSMGREPLHLACANGYFEIAKLLVCYLPNGSSELYNRPWADSFGQTPFFAACQSGCCELVTYLYERGADIEAPAVSLFQIEDIGEEAQRRTLSMKTSPLTCAVLCLHISVVRLLLEWNANQKTTAQCARCADGVCSCEALVMHNRTPFEIAEDGVLSDELVALLSCHKKRKRRGTPVKQRAANAGVTLPPTPEGIRAGVEDSSPGKRKQSKGLLQRHQKACQQLVDRREMKISDRTRHYRFCSLRQKADASRYTKKREAAGKVTLQM
jgi:hypothetical protein